MNDNNLKNKFSQKQIIIGVLLVIFLFLIGIFIFSQSRDSTNSNSGNSSSNNSSQKINSSVNSQVSSIANSSNNSQSSAIFSSIAENSPKKADPIPANPTPANLLKSSEKSTEKPVENQNSSTVQPPIENNLETKDKLPEGDWKPVAPQKPSTTPEG